MLIGTDEQASSLQDWFSGARFEGITRLYSPRQVLEQRGLIETDYPIARNAAEQFYARLRELFKARKSITTFGPYSSGQAVVIKRIGIEAIYVGGWATSAKGSITEDPGADLASYPLNQVPDEAAAIVRALLVADKNQTYARRRMTYAERAAAPPSDYRPFIIADADTGHGGDAHVRNLIRRFVEAGVPGYHIEDQKPGVKKCGHQGGKVLVSQNEQIQRLNAARFQLDIMNVPGIIVARTDAEAANLLDGCADERDQPFILGACNVNVPSYKIACLAVLKKLVELGIDEIKAHLMFAISEADYAIANTWLESTGLMERVIGTAKEILATENAEIDAALDKLLGHFIETWQTAAELKTYAQAVADAMQFMITQGETLPMSSEEWRAFAKRASWSTLAARARTLGVTTTWDPELAKTPDGYYQVQGGIGYAIAKSLAAAPFADILWMETNSASLDEAREFAEAVHAEFPEKMLAYNLSPSFSWDTTGMSDDAMRRFPAELGKLGFVFNFITYGGHQIDGVAAEEFALALKEEGILALARLQRKIGLLESPYRTPQTLVGSQRLDAALMACSGRTATTKAMGKRSTHHQHLVQTEVSPALLTEWLQLLSDEYRMTGTFRAQLRPVSAGSDFLELSILNGIGGQVANVVFADVQDRHGNRILSIRDQNTFDLMLRRIRLMTLAHLFLIKRYKITSVHYLSPTNDNKYQTERMKELGIFSSVNMEAGLIIVATVDSARVGQLLGPDRVSLRKLIAKRPY